MEDKHNSRGFRCFVVVTVLILAVYSVCLTVFVSLLARDHWALESYATSLETRLKSIEDTVKKQHNSPPVANTKREKPEVNAFMERQRTKTRVAIHTDSTLVGRVKRGQRGCYVCKSTPGIQGQRGRKGRKGLRGRPGVQGPKGDQGVPGPQGHKGETGPEGLQGPVGPRGEPAAKGNDTVIAESAHFTGDGNRKVHAGVITYWQQKHTRGSLRYNPHTGELTIGHSGFYFVYSQMYYYDGTTLLLSHYTLLNGRKIMGSSSSVVSQDRKYNTNYHGGVFLLHNGDRISISVLISKVYFMKPEYSYFGVFMLHHE